MNNPSNDTSPNSPWNAAPIPSPHGEIETPPPLGKRAGYGPVVAVGIASFGLQWLLKNLIGVHAIAAFVLTANIVLLVCITLQVQSVGQKLEWKVRSFADVAEVRRVVSLNMKGACTMMVALWPFFLIVMISGAFYYSFAIMLICVPSGLWATSIEKRFKAMPVESDDTFVELEFKRILAFWKEPRFGIPQEKSTQLT